MHASLLYVPALLVAFAAAQQPTTCVTTAATPKPQGVLCHYRGALKRNSPYKTFAVGPSTDPLGTCRDSCLSNSTCSSFGYITDSAKCELYAYNLQPKGTPQTSGPTYYGRACFFQNCGPNLLSNPGFDQGPVGNSEPPPNWYQGGFNDAVYDVESPGYFSPNALLLDFNSTGTASVPNWFALVQFPSLVANTTYSAQFTYKLVRASENGTGYELVFFYESQGQGTTPLTYIIDVSAAKLNRTAGKWATIAATFTPQDSESFIVGVAFGTEPGSSSTSPPAPIAAYGTVKVDSLVLVG